MRFDVPYVRVSHRWINAFVWLYQIYLRLISLTTLIHVIRMRPRLLLKVPAKNYDPAKLLWWFVYEMLIGWLVQYYNYYTSIMYEWTLINTLQSDTFSRMFSQCWTHTKAAVKAHSQSILIDHTCGVFVLILIQTSKEV